MAQVKRVLLVDDSKTQLTMVQMALSKMGVEVLTAENGIEGVSRAFLDKPDLIVSDVMMPELNGYQLCRLLKSDPKTAHIPIILLTSLSQPQDKFWGIRAGADQYIVKKSDLTDLGLTIRKILKNTEKNKQIKKDVNLTNNKSTEWKSIKTNVNRLLDKLLFESTLASEARLLANYIHDKEDLLKEVIDLASSLVDYSCLCLCLFDRKGTKLYYDLKQALSDKELSKIKEDIIKITDESKKKTSIETLLFKGSLKINNKAKGKILSKLIVPLNIHNECIGYLSFLSTKKNAFASKTEDIIYLLAHDFSMVFKLMLLYDETKELSITDGLTQLYNKRYFLETLEKEFVRAKRFGNELSVILMDIDHFKSVNDTYGHVQGDSILKEMGEIINRGIRKVDFPARYGGEEFIIITPNTNIQDAIEIAERVRDITEKYDFKTEKKPLRITISLGVATMNKTITNKTSLIKRADGALYQAKDSGRNRVCVAESH